ncbi:hypothetical protein GUITHDRAFT_115791 [Guillardia theta CCMP2712]|uniref:Uncharacterized protein n=1 Tax=Guillardia theta (strain CCMP2712) TaxID=905079 RepID=L1IP34_GUITC|nr:hypothetical protein GUITHDRAFT_115791 [Guillardia theta CCMP2712]EKX38028.1 hypothetical protein GUITHDRAFT_115791 [Guillardia theta CCMP2712]|eukprot:XP_005825008.1 hypothetical protein GUITHDRAFT_115791 [Guillardia theta CCMP2712]
MSGNSDMEKKIEELTWNLQARNGEISNLRARLQSANDEMDKLRSLNHELVQSRGKGGGRPSSDLEKEISQVKTNLAFKENEYNSLSVRFGEVERNLKIARERCQEIELSKSKLEQELHATKKRCMQGDVTAQMVPERQERLSQVQVHKSDFSMQVETDSMASHRRPTLLDPDSRLKLKRLRCLKALFPENIEEFISSMQIDGESSANRLSVRKPKSDQFALSENAMYKMLSAFVNGMVTADDLRAAMESSIRKELQDTGNQAPKLDRSQREDRLQDLHITLRCLHALLTMSHVIRERLLEEMLHEDLSSSVSLNSTEISSAGKVQDNTGTERYSDADQNKKNSQRDKQFVFVLLALTDSFKDSFKVNLILLKIFQILLENTDADAQVNCFEALITNGCIVRMLGTNEEDPWNDSKVIALDVASHLCKSRVLVSSSLILHPGCKRSMLSMILACLELDSDSEKCSNKKSRARRERALRIFATIASRYKDGIEVVLDEKIVGTIPWKSLRYVLATQGEVIVAEVQSTLSSSLDDSKMEVDQTREWQLLRESVSFLAFLHTYLGFSQEDVLALAGNYS